MSKGRYYFFGGIHCLINDREGDVEVVGFLQNGGDHRVGAIDGLDERCLFTELVQSHQPPLVENRLGDFLDKGENSSSGTITQEDGREREVKVTLFLISFSI